MNTFVNNDDYNKLLDIAFEVSNRLKDPEKLLSTINTNSNIWEGVCLSHGHPGICLLMGELSTHYPDQEWDIFGHKHISIVNELIYSYGVDNLSLFSGLAGIGMGAYALSNGKTRYTNFIDNINKLILSQLDTLISNLYSKKQTDLKMTDYDVILGLSGIGRYLLIYADNPEIKNALENILNYLVEITQDIEIDGIYVPGWYISSQNQFLEAEREAYPRGNFNTGLSHGISGPLSLMSIALNNNVEVKGQKEAIVKVTEWLIKWSSKDEYGTYITGHISMDEQISGSFKTETQGNREAWCYGNPGVARSIWLAGNALNNETYKNFSIDAYKATLTRPFEQSGIFSPIFCHGFAGNMHIYNLMYKDTKIDIFKDAISDMIKCIIKCYDYNNLYGFYDINPLDGIVHSPGLLDGSTGIILSILAVLNPVKTNWDATFLLT